MTEPGEEALCGRCGRLIDTVGAKHRSEYAWNADGEPEAKLFRDKLVEPAPWPAKFRLPGVVRRQEMLATLAVRMEQYCYEGKLDVPKKLNYLHDGIWEFKAGKLRFPFFHTTQCHPRTLRLTHGFVKNSESTPLKEIRKALAIRERDQKHGTV